MMTAVFASNLRRFDGNPHDVETPFGKPIQLGVGNEFGRSDALKNELSDVADKLDAICVAARRLLDNAEGHYMNAEDMYSLQFALGYFDEDPAIAAATPKA